MTETPKVGLELKIFTGIFFEQVTPSRISPGVQENRKKLGGRSAPPLCLLKCPKSAGLNRVKKQDNYSLFSGIAYFARLISPLIISPNNDDCLSAALLIFQWVQRQPNYIVSLPFFVLCALPSIDTFHWLGTLKSTPTRTPRVFNLLLHYTSILQFFSSKPDKSQDKVTAGGGRNWVWWCFVGFPTFFAHFPLPSRREPII